MDWAKKVTVLRKRILLPQHVLEYLPTQWTPNFTIGFHLPTDPYTYSKQDCGWASIFPNKKQESHVKRGNIYQK